MVMNIFFKVGKLIFQIFAVFLILLALFLEHFSKIKSISNNEYNYSRDDKTRKINLYPHLKHYGY